MLVLSALASAAFACPEIDHHDIVACVEARGFTSESDYALRSFEIGLTTPRLQANPHASAIELYHHCACVMQLGYPTICPSAYTYYQIQKFCNVAFPDGTGNATVPLRYIVNTIGLRQSPGDPYPCRFLPGTTSATGDECTASIAWEFVPGEEEGFRIVITLNDDVLPVIQGRFDPRSAGADEYIISRESQLYHPPNNGDVETSPTTLLENEEQTFGCLVFYDKVKFIGGLSCGIYSEGSRHVEILLDTPTEITEAEFANILATAPVPPPPSPPPSPSPSPNVTGGASGSPSPLPSPDSKNESDGAADAFLDSPFALLLAFHLSMVVLGQLHI